jgi:thiamine-monophosphate kinase
MDTIVEGVHFPAGTDAADVGYRALAVNLSDLAAMGAQPSWMTLSLSLPQANEQWLGGFAQGLFGLADAYQVALIGGDTVRGPLVVTVQVAGLVDTGWLTRSGARPGDLLFISGVPGEAAAGLAMVQGGRNQTPAEQHLRQRFLRPTPRVTLGNALRGLASAAMDVSDGVLVDLEKLCGASGCAARLDVDALPASTAMQALFSNDDCVHYALAGGDDYEIMFTLPAAHVRELSVVTDGGPVCTRIGVITEGRGVECSRQGRPFVMRQRGYDHFAQGKDRGTT